MTPQPQTNPQRVVLTPTGAARLRDELDHLKSVDRPAVIAAIAEARAHGDLSENAEYDAAKEQQGHIEGRIAQLEASLGAAEIIDPKQFAAQDKVMFGAIVELYDSYQETEVTYQLVGHLEADLAHRRISVESPIGRAILGKREGDEFEFNAPAGKRAYEVLKVRYE